MSAAIYFERRDLADLKKSRKKTFPAKDHITITTYLLDEIDSLRAKLDEIGPGLW